VKAAQHSLFDAAPDLPEGMTYAEEIIPPGEEQRLTHFIGMLPLKPFEFVGGLKGNRKVLSFGFRYDWGAHQLQQADEIPAPSWRCANGPRLSPAWKLSGCNRYW
jgi:hypothetical protein